MPDVITFNVPDAFAHYNLCRLVHEQPQPAVALFNYIDGEDLLYWLWNDGNMASVKGLTVHVRKLLRLG